MKKSFTILIVMFLSTMTAQAQMGGGMMMHGGQDDGAQAPANTAEGIFRSNCARCHFDGGNVINPDLPIQASSKLSDFKTFLIFIRHPTKPNGEGGAMPAYSKSELSDRQLLELYKYIVARYGVPKPPQ